MGNQRSDDTHGGIKNCQNLKDVAVKLRSFEIGGIRHIKGRYPL